jgi:hypothetical protein
LFYFLSKPPKDESEESIKEFFDWYQHTTDFQKFCEAVWPEDDDDLY